MLKSFEWPNLMSGSVSQPVATAKMDKISMATAGEVVRYRRGKDCGNILQNQYSPIFFPKKKPCNWKV